MHDSLVVVVLWLCISNLLVYLKNSFWENGYYFCFIYFLQLNMFIRSCAKALILLYIRSNFNG